jgi:hypothetical protein
VVLYVVGEGGRVCVCVCGVGGAEFHTHFRTPPRLHCSREDVAYVNVTLLKSCFCTPDN